MKRDKWWLLGKYLGYPNCCIESFMELEHLGEIRNFYGTGFVPCKKCNTLPESVVVQIINTNRLHPVPFYKNVYNQSEIDDTVFDRLMEAP